MKTIIRSSIASVVMAAGAWTTPLLGQSTVTTSTSSTGTVSKFTPEAMVVSTTTTHAPVQYRFTKTTTYVDEAGNPVSMESVRSGAPVEVVYENRPEGMVADKVVLKKTITTTTETPVPTAPSMASQPPQAEGMITEADSDDISMRAGGSNDKLHYTARDSTAYVDEAGLPVPRSVLKKGTPVTIFYERDGDSMIATRVVVKKAPATIQMQTTTTTQESMSQ